MTFQRHLSLARLRVGRFREELRDSRAFRCYKKLTEPSRVRRYERLRDRLSEIERNLSLQRAKIEIVSRTKRLELSDFSPEDKETLKQDIRLTNIRFYLESGFFASVVGGLLAGKILEVSFERLLDIPSFVYHTYAAIMSPLVIAIVIKMGLASQPLLLINRMLSSLKHKTESLSELRDEVGRDIRRLSD